MNLTMKKLLLISLITLLFYSCSKKTTSTDVLPLPFASVQGTVVLYTATGTQASTSYGVTVSLDGTIFKTTVDSTGEYNLSNIPQGVYTLTFSQPGYSSYKIYNSNILSGTTAIQYSTVNLYQPSTTSITNLAIQSSYGFYSITGKINPPIPGNLQESIVFFLSTSDTVSPTNYINSIYLPYTNTSATSVGTFSESLGDLYSYFPSGSTVYAVAYASYATAYGSYINPATGKTNYTGLSAIPSNTISIPLP